MADLELTIALRWNDFDALQHVNNVRYLEFMQDGRVALFTGMGLDRSYLQRVGHFVARTEIDYLAPIPMDQENVKLLIWVEKIGGASYDLGYEILDSNGQVCAKAKTVMVTVEMETNTVTRIPEDIRQKLSARTR